MIDDLVEELLSIAEAPLYSVYCWVSDRLAEPLDMRVFLQIVDSSVAARRLKLWSVTPGTGVRHELAALPSGLAERYSSEFGLDPEYDPFTLSLTLAEGVPREQPTWQLTIDHPLGRFELFVSESAPWEEVLETVGLQLWPMWLEVEETARRGDQFVVVGRVHGAKGSRTAPL